MAYKSVINIEKDKKKRQKILNDLKNSRTKTSYNSTSGAQGQATATTSRATTRTSSTQRTSSGTSMRERVANNNKGKSYYIGRGYQDRGATKTYTYKRSDDPDELTRLRQQAGQEEQGEYYKRQADNPDYGNTKAGKEQQSRIRAYQNAPKGRTVTTTGYRDEDWESKDASLSRDASLNRYRGSLNYTVRQAEKSNDDWKEWQRSLNGITSENPDDYNSKVAKGKKNNPLRQNGYGVDEQTLEYFDFLYGSGHAREARQGIDILKRSDKLRGDIDTKVGEYQNAALKSNQNIANNYKNEASKIQKRIDDIRDGKIQVSDPWGEIAALDDQRAEYEAKGREMQGYADLDKNITSTKVAMDKDPDAQKKIEEGKKKDTFLPGNANENVIQRVLDNSIGMQVLGQTGLFDDLSLKNVVKTMTPEELDMYFYKRYSSEDEAMEYLRTLYNTSIDKDGNLAGGLSNRYVEAVNNAPGMDKFNSVFGYVHTFGAGVQNAGVGIKDAFARMGGDESVHLEGLTQKLYQDNVEKGRVNKVAGDVIFNVGNMMPAIAVSVATGGMGAAPVVSAIASSTTTGLGSFGNTYQQARREGFASDEATGYALLNGISEAALQYVLTGVGQLAGGFTTKTLSENAVKAIGQAVKNPVAKYVIGTIVGQSINAAGEFTEEYLQEILDPVFRNWALGESNEFQPFTPEALYSGILGALSAGLMNTVEVRGNIAQYTRNGQIHRENVIDLINQALTFSNDEEARKTAQYLQEKIKNGGQVTDMEAGLLVKQTDDALALENEIRQYQYGDADWETLSDRARATLVTPANAEYLAREFGFNVNENMTPDEMRAAVDDAVQEARASENRRSFSELVNDQMAAAQTDEDRAEIQKNAQQNQELFNDTEEATGKRIEVADLGRGVNGYTTADKIVINSEIANTEDGARFALAHELTHGTELSRHYGALRDAAMRFYGDNWESEVEKIMKRYQKINPGFSRQQAETEVVADFVGNKVFTDIESMKQFIRDHKTTARRIFSWLKNKLSNTSGQENKALRDAYNAFERAFNEIDRSLEGRRAAMQYQYNLATGAQYSIDNEYMDAVNNGDMEAAQRMVDEAAKRAGYDSPFLFHGTPTYGFTEFDDSKPIFTTTNKTMADSYISMPTENTRKLSDPRSEQYTPDNIPEDKIIEGLSRGAAYGTKAIKLTPNNNNYYGAMFDYISSYVRGLAQDLDYTLTHWSNGIIPDYLVESIKRLEEFTKADNSKTPIEYKKAIETINRLATEVRSNISKARSDDLTNAAISQTTNSDEDVIRESYRESVLMDVAYVLKYSKDAVDGEPYFAYVKEGDESVVESILTRQEAINDAIETLGNEEGTYGLAGTTDNMLEVDAQNSWWNAILHNLRGKEEITDTNEIVKIAKEQGYKGAIIKNVIDYSLNSDASTRVPADVYVYFDTSSLKSLDPVTYDEDGNVIPPSQRFNENDRRIQYSLSDDAVEHFGTTDNWLTTGYVTPDGSQLDFSGQHWSENPLDKYGISGIRAVDHRDVSEIMGDIDGTDAMVEFMDQGNIRISPEIGGINLSTMPTDEQFRSLADMVRAYEGDVTLDVDDEDGRTMFSKDYPMGTNPSTVLNDIRNYFNENVQPEDALYSRGEDEQSLRSLSEKPLESIRQYSLNARTTQYIQDYGDFDAKQKEDSKNVYEAVIQLSNIHKMLVDLHKEESGIKRVALSVHEINEVLHAHPEIWDELIAIRDQFSALGIHSDFVTDRNENGTRLLQGEEVPGGVVGLPIEYRMNEDGTPTFKRFWRTLPQIFMDNMDSTTKERLRAIYVQATEQAYAANRGDYMPDIMTVENFPNLKDYEKALKKFQKESKFVGGELSASTLSNRMKKERLQAPVRKAEKTVMALNLNSACPMFTVGNHGCYLDACYLTQMGKGAMGVNLFDSAFYSGEVLQLKDSDIQTMNAMGGLRLNGVGDTTSGNAQQMVDIIKHANMRGLEIKIITKQMETLRVLKMAHDQGIDVSNVTVQPSMDYLWTPVELDDVFGSGIRGDIPGVENKASTGIGATLKKWNEASESEREDMVQQFEMGYEHFFGRAVMYKDGVLYRKYGFSSDQIRSMMEEFDYVKITPRYVVCTAQEIAETALNRNGQVVNQGQVIQTLMHGVVPDECISEYGGEVLNFGSARHVIEKNADGEWDFYGVKKNAKTGKDERINSAPHQKVLDYVRENYTPEEQDKIWSTLKRSACCQNNDFKDACAGCQSLCAGGCGLCSIKPNTGADTTGRQFSLSDDGSDNTSDNVTDNTEEVSADRQILDNAAEAYGTIPPGENPVRESNVPKRTSENRFVSKFARTLYEAGATTDEMIPALESGLAAEDFSYERISNKKLAKGAEDTIKIDGLDSARRQWDGVAERSDAATAQDIALGQYLYNEYVKAGDYDNAIQVAIDLARKATTAGQTVQAFRLLKKITPDGQLYALEKLANDYNKQLSQRKIKGFSGIQIDENLAKQLLEAKTKEEINAAREAIMQNIADQVPATWVDKLNAWRYMSMLFNPRTHIRNIVGNAMFAPVRGLKDLIGAGLESAVQKAGGMKQTERTKTVVNPFDKANKPLFDKAREAFEEDADIIRGEDKYGKNEMDRRRRIFKSRVLNWIDKFNSAALEKEDVIFMKKAYIGSYVKAMKARGLTPETMTPAQENEISAYAIREAQKATYRDANALAQALNKFKRSNKFAHILGEGLFPFTKTPLNILKRGVEYSPLGIIKGVYQAYNSVKNGNYTAAEAIDSMASGMAGTGILALGMFLASQGLIKGGSGDDDEAALDSLQGGQEYSLVIGDKSYTLDWAAPVALPLFIGVEIFNTMNNESSGEANFSRIVDSVTKISDPLFNLSMLSSLNSAIDAIKYSEGSPLTEIGINVVTSYAGQYVPTIFGQFARIIDENQRKTFYGKDSKMPKAVDSLWQGAVKKIPFLSMIMQPSVDRWGREKKTENITERTLENLVSPGYYSEKSSDNVDIEIDRLYARTGEAGVIPANPEKSIKWTNYDTKETGEMMLTAEEYTKYAKRLGTLSYDGVQKLINSKAYQELNDRDKALAVQEIYDYAKQVAKNEITGGKYQLRDWVQLMKENENVLGDYAVYKTKLSGKDLDTSEKREVLIGMKLPDEVREQIYRASFSESDIKTLDEALSSGARFDQYLNMRIAIDKIDASDSETKNVDKKEWLVNNISSEKSLKALYKTFFETENTNERNTIEYASTQGVNVEHFINREIQKTTEESDYEGTTQDYVYQIVDGVAQVITDEKGKAVYGSKMKKALDDMLSSGYTEDELTYFYQREYGSDDMFVWAKQSGITAKQYMQFRDDTLQLTADKDENGKSISGTKKAKVFDAINAMRLSAVKKLILFSKSYKLSKDQYQQIIDYVQGLKDLSDEEKLMVLQGLKIEVIDGIPYPQKAS